MASAEGTPALRSFRAAFLGNAPMIVNGTCHIELRPSRSDE